MLRDLIPNLIALPVHQLSPPEPFERDTEPTPWPSDCMPQGMREAAAAIARQSKAPEALAGFAVLAAVGDVAQRIADARRHDGSGMPCSLFLLSLADSGDRKSECYRLATAPITKSEREARQDREKLRQTLEAEAAAAKPKEQATIMASLPPDPRTIYTETTAEKLAKDFCDGSRPALSWSSDEGAQFFGGHSMKADTAAASMGMFTKLYDGSGVERSRVGDTGGAGFRYGVRFSFFLSAQPTVVRSALSDEMLRSQGLLARFLLSCPASIKGTRFMGMADLEKADADTALKAYWHTLERMNNRPWNTDEHDSLVLPVADWSEEAKQVWLDRFNAVEAELAPLGELEAIAAFAGRCGENASRTATVFAVWRTFATGSDDLTVTGDDMARAWRLVEYSLAEWLRHYQGSSLSATERDAKALLGFLQRDPAKWSNFTKGLLGQFAPGVLRKDKERRNLAIDELCRRGWLFTRDGVLALRASGVAVALSAVSAVSELKAQEKTAKTAKTATANGDSENVKLEADATRDRLDSYTVARPNPSLMGEIDLITGEEIF